MKAIILAAGIGQRLGDLTIAKPKCLTQVNGRTILGRVLESLEGLGFEKVVIVKGYLGRRIVEDTGDSYGGLRVEYIENEIYARTNSMYSLWLAKETLENGAVVIEGDCVFEKAVFEKMLGRQESVWVAARFTEEMEGSMSTIDKDGKIVEVRIQRERLNEYKSKYFKSAGMLKVEPELGEKLVSWLTEDVKKKNIKIYYDLVIAKHVNDHPIFLCDISGMRWVEIDDLADLRKAEKIFQ